MDASVLDEYSTTDLEDIVIECNHLIKLRKQAITIEKLQSLNNKLAKNVTNIVIDGGNADYIIDENVTFKLDNITCSLYYHGDRSEYDPNIYIGDFISTEDDFDYWDFKDKDKNRKINPDWIQDKKKFKKICKKYELTDIEFITQIVEIFAFVK